MFEQDEKKLYEKNLNKLVNDYNELKAQADDIDNKMSALKTKILEELGDAREYMTTDTHVTAKVVAKETIKYVDESAMINWLKNNGYSKFVVEKVDTTPMNKELKKGLTLTESLKSMFTKTTSYTLKVEEN